MKRSPKADTTASSRPRLADPWQDDTAERAARLMGQVQAGRAAGKPFGVLDGQFRSLSREEYAKMARASEIRDQLRALRASFDSLRAVRRAAPKGFDIALLEKGFGETKRRVADALRRHPTGAVTEEVSSFGRFLKGDAEALALFGEVADAAAD